MIELTPTTLLLGALLVATLLGAGIGACLWHLRLARRHAAALEALRESGERERRAFDAVLSQERETAALKHARDQRHLRETRERLERVTARHEALGVREREQSRRIEVLEAEVLGLEERQMKLQRDLASDRAGRRAAGLPRPTVSRVGDDRLPVLNRRVGAVRAGSTIDGAPFGDGPSIGGDLDIADLEIPELAESELPEEVDDLALELLDAEDLVADR